MSHGLLVDDWGEGTPSDLSRAVDEARAAGRTIIDMVTAPPQEHGLELSRELLVDSMARAVQRARYYRPDPRGQIEAREAVAAYHGSVGPDQVILTPGTSMSYWYAFRLLAQPGDEILCPSPTYPLFEDLATLAHAGVRRYHLHHDGRRWALDPQEIAFQLTRRTRAVVLVSPHNPTGAVCSEAELETLGRLARERGFAIIFDEVFREFTIDPETRVSRPSRFDAPLCVTLNGFSKMFSLPGIKAGWMTVEGDAERCRRFLSAAEYLSDTFLPVNEYTQAAIPLLMGHGFGETRRMAGIVRERMAELVAGLRQHGVAVGMPEAGVYLPVPCAGGATAARSPEDVCMELLRRDDILVHPGSLYGFAEPYLVMTCVHEPPYPVGTIAEALGA